MMERERRITAPVGTSETHSCHFISLPSQAAPNAEPARRRLPRAVARRVIEDGRRQGEPVT